MRFSRGRLSWPQSGGRRLFSRYGDHPRTPAPPRALTISFLATCLRHPIAKNGMRLKFPRCSLRLLTSACLLSIVSGSGCVSDRPRDSPDEPLSAIESDGDSGHQQPLASIPDSQSTLHSAPASFDTAVTEGGCEAQGIAAEESFAQQMCAAAKDFGFKPRLVHSHGAGGVDVFISEADALILRHNQAELRRQTAALTEWAKRNYSAFNAVEVTIVGGDSKMAKGRQIGTSAAAVELY